MATIGREAARAPLTSADINNDTITADDLVTTLDLSSKTLTLPTLSSATITSVDINGGTIDGVTIGGSSAGAITGTTGQFNTSLNVDGTVTADGLETLSTSGDIGYRLGYNAGASAYIHRDSATGHYLLQSDETGASWKIETDDGAGPLTRAEFTRNGDISFYEDTGTTPKFFWDASAEALAVGGTSTFTSKIVASAANGTAYSSNSQLRISGGGVNNNRASILFSDDALSDGKISYYPHAAEASRLLSLSARATESDFVITGSGNVGIGTSSPNSYAGQTALTINSTGVARLDLDINDAYQGYLLAEAGYIGLYAQSGNYISMGVGGVGEAMRITSAGDFLVGKSVTTFNTEGFLYEAGAAVEITTDSNRVMRLNRTTNDGNILEFNKDGGTVGSIGSYSSGIYIHTTDGTDAGLGFRSTQLVPCNSTGGNDDNRIDLGAPSARFDDIYATNGTIQTSDANEKQDIAELDEAERRAAVAAKGLLRKFRWKDSVAEKGDDARIHFGIIAQDLQAAFEAEGLDAGRYAMFIHSTWTDEETGEERSRMGVRYSELLAFIIAAL